MRTGPLLLVVVVLAVAAAPAAGRELEPRDTQLWNQTFHDYLLDELWNDTYAYDAGSDFIVPLEAAFTLGRTDWQDQFAAHFARFAAAHADGSPVPAGIAGYQYLYAAVRFVALAREAGRPGLVPAGLEPFILAEARRLWTTNWRAKVAARLANRPTTDYRQSIGDQPLFLMAITAELRAQERLRGQGERDPVIKEILDTAEQVLVADVRHATDGTWLYEPGVLWQHPDYLYAGRTEKVPGMDPLPVPGIAWDSSHSHRFAYWLWSLERAEPAGSARQRTYEMLRWGVGRQLSATVLVPPTPSFPGWRARNFMDGRNGVYRWGYATHGADNGYGPFELSGTLHLGWWVAAGTWRVRDAMAGMAEQYPLPDHVLATYAGPDTTRPQHPLKAGTNEWTNGLFELVVRLAAALPAERFAPGDLAAGVIDRRLVVYEVTRSASRLTISSAAGTVRVRDTTATVLRGPGCSRIDAHEVRCPAAAIDEVFVDADALDDRVTVSAPLPSRVLGGLGADVLTGGPVADVLRGGDGSDHLSGRGGADDLGGGTGSDAVSYRERTTGVTVDLDGAADDGEPGEGDRVRTDVERLWGSEGPDVLTAGALAETLYGFGGADRLDMRDGRRERAACGAGVDLALLDDLDSHDADCEDVPARP